MGEILDNINMSIKKCKPIIFFECNNQKPECRGKCNNSECCYTSNPKYAKNFKKEINGNGNPIYIERIKNNGNNK